MKGDLQSRYLCRDAHFVRFLQHLNSLDMLGLYFVGKF